MMKRSIFSSLVSITNGLHRDNRSEKQFQILLTDLKSNPLATNAVFKINFKRPLNSKKEYYQKLIFNETEKNIVSFLSAFPKNATTVENKYSYATILNKFDKYLKGINNYICKREISAELNNNDAYIINYLKVSSIRLYAELQEQYGLFSDTPLFTIIEIAEKYFNDTKFNPDLILKAKTPKKAITDKPLKPISRPKTSFSFKSKDIEKLLAVLKELNLKIDLLQNRTTVEDLYKLLIAKDYTLVNTQIYLECETTQFSHIVSELKPLFNSFNPTSIERSGKFITKTGVVLKANNLHKNKVHNPKEKEVISKIIQQLK